MKKKSKLNWSVFILIGTIALSIITYTLTKSSTPLPTQQYSGYITYQNPDFRFSIAYPATWEIRKDTQVFENGDAIAFGIKGSTQKDNTELTDGAQIAISKPFTINTPLAAWIKDNFKRESKFSKFILSKYPYEGVYECSNLGCMTYYFTSINDKVYGVAIFTEGADKEKAAYENATIYMMKSLTFDDAKNITISKEDAVTKVKNLPEVVDYLKRVPNGIASVNGEEENTYLIQVYEFKDNHTATFNWYNVEKTTGVVKKEF